MHGWITGQIRVRQGLIKAHTVRAHIPTKMLKLKIDPPSMHFIQILTLTRAIGRIEITIWRNVARYFNRESR